MRIGDPISTERVALRERDRLTAEFRDSVLALTRDNRFAPTVKIRHYPFEQLGAEPRQSSAEQ